MLTQIRWVVKNFLKSPIDLFSETILREFEKVEGALAYAKAEDHE